MKSFREYIDLITESEMVSEVSGYKKAIVRDIGRWKQIATDNGYQIQDIKNGNFQAWREGPHGGPHLTGFFFNGDDNHPAEFWIRVPQ